jgi:signal transduction histidine kinase
MMSSAFFSSDSRLRTSFIFILGVILALIVALLVTVPALRPGFEDMKELLWLLSVTAVASVGVGYLSSRLGWWSWSRSVRLTLMIGYLMALGLVFLNVLVTARLMFASNHDLRLASILLLFAAGISLSFGYFLSSSITESIQRLVAGAEAIAQGDLHSRVDVQGNDELAELASAFNRMAEQLQDADARQKEVEKLRRDLISWVSHDLRTPLTSMQVMVEALADGVVNRPETVRRYLKTVQTDIQNLSHLIDDLLELAQLDSNRLRFAVAPHSLRDLISDTLESMRPLTEQKGVTLSGDVDPGVDPVLMAPEKISRVLTNLISNAARHTSAGGTIAVEARHEIGHNWVRVDVCDTGEGISPDDLPHIFESFYRGEKSRSRSTGGAGLGLAIAKGIIEAHGGQLWVESQVDKGSTFTFTLSKVLGNSALNFNPSLRQ